MSTLHPETVAIRQLRIRSGIGAGNTRMAQEAVRLRQDIEWADWPDAPGESWVFIRKLHVKASRGQAVQQLMQDARQQVQGGSEDNVIRFASLVALLTALLTDLVQPGTTQRWYWQRWAHLFAMPLCRAIGDLLTEHLAHLPAVCAALSRHGALEQVWLSLDEENASRLQHAIAWRGAFFLPKGEAVQGAQERSDYAYLPEVKGGKEREPAPPRIPETALHISSTVHRRWQPLLQRLSIADARYQLGLLVIGQEVAPLILQQAPAAMLCRLQTLFVPRDAVRHHDQPDTSGTAPPQQPSQPPPSQPIRDASVAASTVDTATAAATAQDETNDFAYHATSGTGNPAARSPSRPPIANTSPSASRSTGTDAAVDADAGLLSVDTVTANAQDAPAADQSAQPDSNSLHNRLRCQAQDRDLAFDQFYTGQGGLLYLLNVLNRSEMQSLMERWWHQLPNGWGWLYRLGQELQLDETDPITTFLATQLGFDHRTELEQLPPLPARPELLELAGRWYGRAALWQPDLLRLRARIYCTPSHVDMYLPLSAVQLPVRLAGLDINPGWLPWLGRVITFHYD